MLIPIELQVLSLFSYPDPESKRTIELNIDFPFKDFIDWTPFPKLVIEIVFIPDTESSKVLCNFNVYSDTLET